MKFRVSGKAIALGVTALAAAGCGAPSDESIISHFNAHRAEFSRVVEMFRHDGIRGRVSCDKNDQEDDHPGPQPTSDARRAEYAKIFRVVGCDTAAYYYPDVERASVTVWTVGMLFSGQDKSIEFIPRSEPSPIVATTDNYQWTEIDRVRGNVEIYRHIDGPWYLEYIAN